jgi:hypothetical protein
MAAEFPKLYIGYKQQKALFLSQTKGKDTGTKRYFCHKLKAKIPRFNEKHNKFFFLIICRINRKSEETGNSFDFPQFMFFVQ